MKNNIGILGGGFGLYGYLPAFLNQGYEIYTLEKYKETLKNREDICHFANKVTFLSNEKELIKNVNNLVIARNPKSQYETLKKYDITKLDFLFLEKPLARNLEEYKELINLLNIKNKNYAIFYSLTYLDWYKSLVESLQVQNNNNYEINWGVNLNNKGWKINEIEGGGLIKYYFIHFIPMIIFSNLEIKSIKNNTNKLCVSLKNNKSNTLTVNISKNKNLNFEIKKNGIRILKHINPFLEEIIPLKKDPRIKIIEKYITDKNVGNLNDENQFFNCLSRLI